MSDEMKNFPKVDARETATGVPFEFNDPAHAEALKELSKKYLPREPEPEMIKEPWPQCMHHPKSFDPACLACVEVSREMERMTRAKEAKIRRGIPLNVHVCRHCGGGHPSWGCRVMAEKRSEDMKRIGSLPTDAERRAAYEAYCAAEIAELNAYQGNRMGEEMKCFRTMEDLETEAKALQSIDQFTGLGHSPQAAPEGSMFQIPNCKSCHCWLGSELALQRCKPFEAYRIITALFKVNSPEDEADIRRAASAIPGFVQWGKSR